MAHFSLLFEPRTTSNGGLEKHAMLCSRVLDIYIQIARNLGSKLNNETWEIILKLFIGIVDSVLRLDAPSNQEIFQRKLCSQILKVLFEVWLHSRTKNPHLWDALKNRVSGWVHHMPLVSTWNLISQSLTKRSIAILYGAQEGTDSVILHLDDHPLSIQMDDEYLFYSWHRMLNLLPNPNTDIKQPGIYLEFMNAVDLLATLYLNVKPNPKNRLLPPSGNTILHIFGKWLFDAVHLDRNGFDDGTARALRTLCNIMSNRHQCDFLPVYYGSFFGALQSALMKEGKILLAAISSSTSIFVHELRGIRALVPSYVSAIYRILTKKVKMEHAFSAEKVRKDCLILLGTLICLPNHFGRTPFTLRINDPKQSSKAFDVQTYGELSPHFSRTLIEALTCEEYPPNIEHLLYLSYIYQCEDLKTGTEFTKQSLLLISRKISQGGGWNTEVSITAIKVLSMMSSLYPNIDKGYELGNRIVQNLCTLILAIPNFTSIDKFTEELVINAYKCITDWLMPEQWIFNFNDTKNMLFKTIVYGLTGSITERKPTNDIPNPANTSSSNLEKSKKDKKDKKESKQVVSSPSLAQSNRVNEKIKEAAHANLLILLNQIGNFPSATGAHSISTLAKEEEILYPLSPNDLEKSKEFIRYFITDEKMLICVIDRRDDPEGPSCCIIIRDKTGRYAWNTRLTYLPLRPKEHAYPPAGLDDPVPICLNPAQALPTIHPSKVDQLTQYLNNSETKFAHPIVNQLVQRENQTLRSNNFKLNSMISIKAPERADPYSGDCKIQQSRMLLSHLGFLSLENRDHLFPINMNENYYHAIRELDSIKERECVKVGVLYIQNNQSEQDAYSNLGGSMDYQEFIASLGWGVALDKHKGYLGTLDTASFKGGVVAPYYSNYCTEILFHVSTLMVDQSNQPVDSQVNYRREQVLNSPVVVCWNEGGINSYQPQSLLVGRSRHTLAIVITPLECGLYQVKLHSKSDFVRFFFSFLFYFINY